MTNEKKVFAFKLAEKKEEKEGPNGRPARGSRWPGARTPKGITATSFIFRRPATLAKTAAFAAS